MGISYGSWQDFDREIIRQWYRDTHDGRDPSDADIRLIEWRVQRDPDGTWQPTWEQALQFSWPKDSGSGSGPGPTPPVTAARPGRVVAVGRSWQDGAGFFYPLGATLFWALRGWKFEPGRIEQNIAWLSGHRWDYVRILCDVAWSGNEVDSTWPDFQALLARHLDTTYDKYGMRTEITLWGGSPHDPLACTDKVIEVSRGREHKILNFECGNEAWKNGPDRPTMEEMARRLSGTGILTATTSGGLSPQEVQDSLFGGANLATVHLERGNGDQGWRMVRQGWDMKDYSVITSHNEPEGPQSSVAECSVPILLAQARALCIGCGGGAWVLHNAAGVSGQVDPNPHHPRPANLWEMPGIDAIMPMVRGIDQLLPQAMEGWQRANDGWAIPKHPLEADAWWSDGDGHPRGVNKNYAALGGDSFVTFPLGVKAPADGQIGVNLRATANCDITVYDPANGAIVGSQHLNQGQTVGLPGRADTLQTYIIRGRRV